MPGRPPFPLMRWMAIAWLGLWVPIYWYYWGVWNFLFLCDMGVLLTCIGLWRGSALLLSSQAVGVILLNLFWTLDAGWRLFLGRHLLGGTEYMWDARYPIWLRAVSLFHVVWPPLLVWAARRTGYDARGFVLQSGIAAVVMTASRIVESALRLGKNLNNMVTDPIFHRSWGPAPAHIALLWGVMIVALYLPTHLLLKKFLPSPKRFEA